MMCNDSAISVAHPDDLYNILIANHTGLVDYISVKMCIDFYDAVTFFPLFLFIYSIFFLTFF